MLHQAGNTNEWLLGEGSHWILILLYQYTALHRFCINARPYGAARVKQFVYETFPPLGYVAESASQFLVGSECKTQTSLVISTHH